jgi:outer membrane protein TolC
MILRVTTRRRLQIVLGIGCALFFGGCAWIPKGDQPAQYLEAPEMTETLAEVTSRLQNWPEDRWWEQFGNPELNGLIEQALNDNPGLKHAAAPAAAGHFSCEGRRRAAVAVSRSRGIVDLRTYFATWRVCGLNPEVAGIRIMYGIINPLSFRYEFDFWGKNRAMLEAALGHAAAEEAETAEVRLRLTTGIARAYFRGQALQQQLTIVKTIVGIRRELKTLAETRFRLGLDNDQPVKIAVADYEAAFKRQAAIRDQLDVQRHLLARLVGKGPDEAGPICLPSRK